MAKQQKIKKTPEESVDELAAQFEEASQLAIGLVLKQLKDPSAEHSLISASNCAKITSDRYCELMERVLAMKKLRNDLSAVEPGSPEEEEILASYKERVIQVHTRQ